MGLKIIVHASKCFEQPLFAAGLSSSSGYSDTAYWTSVLNNAYRKEQAYNSAIVYKSVSYSLLDFAVESECILLARPSIRHTRASLMSI